MYNKSYLFGTFKLTPEIFKEKFHIELTYFPQGQLTVSVLGHCLS